MPLTWRFAPARQRAHARLPQRIFFPPDRANLALAGACRPWLAPAIAEAAPLGKEGLRGGFQGGRRRAGGADSPAHERQGILGLGHVRRGPQRAGGGGQAAALWQERHPVWQEEVQGAGVPVELHAHDGYSAVGGRRDRLRGRHAGAGRGRVAGQRDQRLLQLLAGEQGRQGDRGAQEDAAVLRERHSRRAGAEGPGRGPRAR